MTLSIIIRCNSLNLRKLRPPRKSYLKELKNRSMRLHCYCAIIPRNSTHLITNVGHADVGDDTERWRLGSDRLYGRRIHSDDSCSTANGDDRQTGITKSG